MSKRADRYIAMLNKADEIYQKDYSTGEYCHEQSFKWGFQEGYEATEKNLILKAKRWITKIHRVCDITDEYGYSIELRDLIASFEKSMEEV